MPGFAFHPRTSARAPLRRCTEQAVNAARNALPTSRETALCSRPTDHCGSLLVARDIRPAIAHRGSYRHHSSYRLYSIDLPGRRIRVRSERMRAVCGPDRKRQTGIVEELERRRAADPTNLTKRGTSWDGAIRARPITPGRCGGRVNWRSAGLAGARAALSTITAE